MKKNTVVLFYPKTEDENINRNIPLSLLKVGSQVVGDHYSLVVIDERFEAHYEEKLKSAIRSAICFGATVMTGYQIKGALKASSLVRKFSPGTPVIWGGWHPSILPEETLANSNVDAVVRGQGEVTFSEALKAISEGRSFSGIKGLYYKEGGKCVTPGPRGLIDLNKLHPVSFDILDIEKYIFKSYLGERTIFWNSSQGCPYCCGFCSTPAVFERRWSGVNAEELLRQTKVLVERFGIDGITFADDNFFVDNKRTESFCRGLIENNIKIRWSTDARVDQINRFSGEIMTLLRESGCHKLYIGAESGDDEVLALIDKRINSDDTYNAAEKLQRFNIISEFFMIVGFPNDPEKDLRESLQMIKRIKSYFPNHQFTPFLYTPYPGTPLLDVSVRKGLKIPDSLEGWSDWSILSVSTPWVNNRYLDKVNMFSKMIYPLAYPSDSLKGKFSRGMSGKAYFLLHKLSRFRVERDWFSIPLEWYAVKFFYKLKIKLNIFKGIESFR